MRRARPVSRTDPDEAGEDRRRRRRSDRSPARVRSRSRRSRNTRSDVASQRMGSSSSGAARKRRHRGRRSSRTCLGRRPRSPRRKPESGGTPGRFAGSRERTRAVRPLSPTSEARRRTRFGTSSTAPAAGPRRAHSRPPPHLPGARRIGDRGTRRDAAPRLHSPSMRRAATARGAPALPSRAIHAGGALGRARGPVPARDRRPVSRPAAPQSPSETPPAPRAARHPPAA